MGLFCLLWNCLYKYKLVFSYIGTHFQGSQYQPSLRTVEGVIRQACCRALKTSFVFLASGRTDAGVHAEGQVGSLEISDYIPDSRLVYCLNRCMPEDVVIHSVSLVGEAFHPRFSARWREYHYLYTSSRAPLPGYCLPFVAQVKDSDAIETVRPLLKAVCGTHDFRAFRCLGSSEKSTRKTVFSCDMIEDSFVTPFSGSVDVVRFSIVADSFLYRMVRCLLGALFEVMREPDKVSLFLDSLHSGEKKINYALAPAKGLTLVRVGYEKPIVNEL